MNVYYVLPAYNEEKGLPPLLDKMRDTPIAAAENIRVVVVDDGSADATIKVCNEHPLAKEGRLAVVPHDVNMGLAAAVRTGIDEFLARSEPGDIMVTMDADNTHDPKYTPELVSKIQAGAGMAICSRFAAGGKEEGVNAYRKLLSRGAKSFMDLLAPIPNVKDISCGYRAYSREGLERARKTFGAHLVQSVGGSVQAELLVRLSVLGEKIVEIPFTLRYDLKDGPSKLGMATTIKGYFALRQIKRLSEIEHRLNAQLPSETPDGEGILALICTYNERKNITPLIKKIFSIVPNISILVVDDGSPDGTGEAVEKLKNEYPKLNIIHREGKLGLGSAITTGFKWGKEKGFKAVVNMDADFSHDPISLPAFILKSRDAEYVIGSRYVSGGGTINWGFHRRFLSKMGNTFARTMLSLPVRDLTTGYRLVDMRKFDLLNMETITAKGYGFLIVMTHRAAQAGLKIAEVPIRFMDRQYGDSKMSVNIIQEAFQMVLRLRSEAGKK